MRVSCMPASIILIIIDYLHTSSINNTTHRLSINRPTKIEKEKVPSDGHCQCEKEMDNHLLACQ
jgi:hypothetical protein